MNPVLLKPTGERTSQVVVMGRAVGEQSAADYHAGKSALRPTVLAALDDLRSRYDVVVCEGAGGRGRDQPAGGRLRQRAPGAGGGAAGGGRGRHRAGRGLRLVVRDVGLAARRPAGLRAGVRHQPLPGGPGVAGRRLRRAGAADGGAGAGRGTGGARYRHRRRGLAGPRLVGHARPGCGRCGGRGRRPLPPGGQLRRPRPAAAGAGGGGAVGAVGGGPRAARPGGAARVEEHPGRPGVVPFVGAGRSGGGVRGAGGGGVRGSADDRGVDRRPLWGGGAAGLGGRVGLAAAADGVRGGQGARPPEPAWPTANGWRATASTTGGWRRWARSSRGSWPTTGRSSAGGRAASGPPPSTACSSPTACGRRSSGGRRPTGSRPACPSPPNAPPASTASPTPSSPPWTSIASSPSSTSRRPGFLAEMRHLMSFLLQKRRSGRSPTWCRTSGGGSGRRATATCWVPSWPPTPTGWRRKWRGRPPVGGATTPRCWPPSGGRPTPTGWRARPWPRGWCPAPLPTRPPPAPAWDWPAADRRRSSSTPTPSSSTTSTTWSNGCSRATSTRS